VVRTSWTGASGSKDGKERSRGWVSTGGTPGGEEKEESLRHTFDPKGGDSKGRKSRKGVKTAHMQGEGKDIGWEELRTRGEGTRKFYTIQMGAGGALKGHGWRPAVTR